MLAENPWLSSTRSSGATPDGDAELDFAAFPELVVPSCPACNGVLKPAVVFFGESVPAQRVSDAYEALADSQALLVVGSSLMVFSGFRFVRRAVDMGKPIVVINHGLTRADAHAALKVDGSCGVLLDAAVTRLEAAHE